MNHSIRLSRKVLGCAAILVTVGLCMAQPPYRSPYRNPKPYMGHTGRSGPPLSTALPTTGPYSRGMAPTGTVSTGASSVRRPTPFVAPSTSLRNQLNFRYSLATPQAEISGRTMSRVYLNRAIYSGVPIW